MQKVLTLLEKNVQWVALGLGGVYLLWMLWSYVLMPPVSTTLDSSTEATLRTIDKTTLNGPAQRLERAMDAAGDQRIQVQEFTPALAAKIKGDETYPLLSGIWTTSQSAPINLSIPGPNVPEDQPAQGAVAQLPQLPPPTYLEKSQGLSTITIPNVAAAPGAVAVAMPDGANVTQQDRQWVSTSYQVAMAPLAASFAKANVPQELRTTYFLRVEAVREELDSNGKWGNPTVVKPLLNTTLPPMPDNWQAQVTYGDWAMKNQVEILQPSFYQVVGADRWLPPGYHPPTDTAGPNQPFDPANPPTNRRLTPEEIQAVNQHKAMEAQRKREEAEQRRRDNTPTRRPRQPTRPRRPEMPNFAPRDLEREALAQANPRTRYPNMPPDMGYVDIDEYQGGPAQRQLDPALPPPPPVPTGAFLPSNQPDVVIWVHDDTVQPGKTYRYKIRYAIKNPLFRVPNIVKDRKDAELFAIWSDYSAYSTTIEIPDLTNFFVSANMGGSPIVSFDVFRWQKGQQNKQTVRVGAGDMIGTEQDGIDYRTGWTVVDVRENQRGDTYVMLMDPQGDLLRRDFRSDQQKELYKQLQKDAEAARLAAAPPVGQTR